MSIVSEAGVSVATGTVGTRVFVGRTVGTRASVGFAISACAHKFSCLGTGEENTPAIDALAGEAAIKKKRMSPMPTKPRTNNKLRIKWRTPLFE
jgi:hypothetical protein